jgi:tryptophan synthase alpha chain
MSAERLRRLFESVRAEGRTAFLPFMTAGLPDPAHTVDLFQAMADAGADAFEVGIPYSDPLMDGPTIQAGSARALAQGMTLEVGLGVAESVVNGTGTPVLVMTYANPVYRIGPAAFAARAAAAGVSGIIVPDLPLEETADVKVAMEAEGIGMVLFAAPTTGEARLEEIAAHDPVFIYGVAEMGVTGERVEQSDRPRELAARVRSVTDAPLVMGVGISTPDQAAAVADLADGVIVGSALVRRVLEADSPEQASRSVAEAVAGIAGALR